MPICSKYSSPLSPVNSRFNKTAISGAIGLYILSLSFGAAAQSMGSSPLAENGSLIKNAHNVSKLGTDLFGDKVNLSNGALEFVQTDVAISGNSRIPVEITRRMQVGGRGTEGNGLFVNWDLAIPRIYGMFSTQYGWQGVLPSPAAANTPTPLRCSNFGAPPTVYQTNSNNRYRPTEYWRGHTLYIPGEGEQEILKRNTGTGANNNFPSDGQSYPLVTKNLWAIRCLSSLSSSAVGTVPANEGGEGFLAISPDGTQYKFDWLVSRPMSSISKPVPLSPAGTSSSLKVTAENVESGMITGDPKGNGRRKGNDNAFGKADAGFGQDDDHGKDAEKIHGKGNEKYSVSPLSTGGGYKFTLWRTEVSIFPTLLTDRYGNTVRFTYDSTDKWKLLNIKSADGAGNNERVLNITYYPGTKKIQTVSDGSRTWTYTYGTGQSGWEVLTTVSLPDGSSWNLGTLDGTSGQPGIVNLFLDYADTEQNYQDCDAQPEGLNSPVATGSITHPSGAVGSFTMTPMQHARNGVPRLCYSDGLINTTGTAYYPQYFDMYSLTSKSISGPGLPTMTWSTAYDTWNPGWADCTTCAVPNKVTVTDPKGHVNRFTFGSTFGVNEGLLLGTENIQNGTALKSVAFEYAAFTNLIGSSGQDRGDAKLNQVARPLKKRVTSQQGVDFTWEAPALTDFNQYYQPLKVKKFSSLGPVRTETATYFNHTPKWVMGQLASITETSTGKVVNSNTYNATTGVLETTSKFGKLKETYTYHADGNLASIKDGNNKVTSFSSYKRGIPRSVSFPTGFSRSVVVNDFGKITSTTDEAGFTTTFGLDQMGRVSSISYPTADTVAWTPTTVTLQQVQNWDQDIAPGHWRKQVTTGNQRQTTYFDALLRPVYVEEMDLANPSGTTTIAKTGFDHHGNIVFASYPKRTYAELGDGVHTEYDALNRPTVTGTITENGLVYSGYYYGSGYSTIYTDGRQNNTTTTYLAFDDPASSQISNISYPAGVTLSIDRNIFGMPRTVTRSGGGKSLVKSVVYDSYMRPCKTIEPEIGATVIDYDNAGNIAWKAIGVPLTSTTSCDQASVTAAKKITFGYDALNRMTSTTYGDGSAPIGRTYTPDGLTATATSTGSTWTYGYNKRRLLETETLNYGGVNYVIGRNYDALGNLAKLTYPDSTSILLNPNALGQERQVGSFASNILYHPNGAIASFTYGNGITHSLTQNVRGLPDRATDMNVVNDAYAFDANANVTSILDWQEGISNRAMEYDELNRLKRVVAPTMWGEALYSYDALNNLTSATLTTGTTARTNVMTIDPVTNRLTNVSGPAGFNFGYSYDGQGNVSQRGTQQFVFDQANRMKQATGKATYVYDGMGRRVSVVGLDALNKVQMYSLNGHLLYTKPTTSSATTKYVYLRSHLLAEVNPSGTQYVHTDALGSPIARTSSTGTLVSRTRYEPFGFVNGGATPTIGFTGHVNDVDTGLTYMQQRYYDPVAARFLSIDPVEMNANSGVAFNRYNYAHNNPYSAVDPDGRWATWIHHRITMAAALRAGLNKAQAKELADKVVKVDKSTQGSSKEQTNIHGMAGLKEDGKTYQSREEAIAGTNAIIKDPDKKLEVRLHASQDSEAEHHLGVEWHDPLDWTDKSPGQIVKDLFSALVHLIKDVMISDEHEKKIIEKNAKMIEEKIKREKEEEERKEKEKKIEETPIT